MIRICGVVRESIVDGPGLRFVLFTQGCPHHCPGCHNPESHALDGGYEVTAEKVLEEFKKNPLLKGITLSGGDPILQAGELVGICREVHAMGKDVMTYTGYTYEELLEMQKTDEGIRQLLEEKYGRDDSESRSGGDYFGNEKWAAVKREIAAADEGDTIKVSATGLPWFPSSVARALKGHDITLEIRKNGTTYSVNGEKIGAIEKIWYEFDQLEEKLLTAEAK